MEHMDSPKENQATLSIKPAPKKCNYCVNKRNYIFHPCHLFLFLELAPFIKQWEMKRKAAATQKVWEYNYSHISLPNI